MSSHENSLSRAGTTPGEKVLQSPPDSDEEPTNLVINIKEEPADDGYQDGYQDNGKTANQKSLDLQETKGKAEAESESDYYKEINIPRVVVSQKPRTKKTKMVLPPCISVPLPNGGSSRPFKPGGKCSSRDLTLTSTVMAKRLVPISIKTSGPIPIALTLNKSAADPKTNPSTPDSQAQAHHLMTLATEADKILQKQEKRLNSEKGSTSDHSGEGKFSNSDDDTCSSSDSSGGGMDSFLNANDQTLTFIQRRAAEASISSKKSKRKRNQLPDDMKDDTYWERRRKNNEAAKRSRDARRAKEDQIAVRAALLEQENMRLRIEVAALKEETIRLKGLLCEK